MGRPKQPQTVSKKTKSTPKKPERVKWSRNTKNSTVVDKIIKAGRKAGLSDYAIAGIIGNAVQEKGHNFDLKDRSNYHGLFQIEDANWNLMKKVYGGDSIDHQIQYAIDHALGKIDKKYSGNLGYKQGSMKRKFNSASEAADAFLMNFERAPIRKNGKTVGWQGQANRRAYANDALEHLRSKDRSDVEIPMEDVQDMYMAQQEVPNVDLIQPQIATDYTEPVVLNMYNTPLTSNRFNLGQLIYLNLMSLGDAKSFNIELPNLGYNYNTII